MLPPGAASACREAVRRVLHNRAALVRFSLRGVGERGLPRVSAPLAGVCERRTRDVSAIKTNL